MDNADEKLIAALYFDLADCVSTELLKIVDELQKDVACKFEGLDFLLCSISKATTNLQRCIVDLCEINEDALNARRIYMDYEE